MSKNSEAVVEKPSPRFAAVTNGALRGLGMLSVGSLKPANSPSKGKGIEAESAVLIGTGSNTDSESKVCGLSPALPPI